MTTKIDLNNTWIPNAGGELRDLWLALAHAQGVNPLTPETLGRGMKFLYAFDRIIYCNDHHSEGSKQITLADLKPDKSMTIPSFAPRKNTGQQPCDGDLPVVTYWRDMEDFEHHKDGRVSWTDGMIKYWMPDLDALIKMQDEHDKKQAVNKPKPKRVNVSYERVSFIRLSEAAVAIDAGDIYFVNGGNTNVDDKSLAKHYHLTGDLFFFRKIQTEITWQDELKEFVDECDTLSAKDTIDEVWQACAGSVADKYRAEFIKMCRVTIAAVDGK